MGNTNLDLINLIENYSHLFENMLGCYQDEIIHLQVTDNIKHVFAKPRKLPFAFKEKLEKNWII